MANPQHVPTDVEPKRIPVNADELLGEAMPTASNPPPPEDTNRSHYTRPGEQVEVPGAGLVRPESTSFPKQTSADPAERDYQGEMPKQAPRGEPGQAANAPTLLNPPTGGTGAPFPGSAGQAARETNDPNAPNDR